MRKLLFLALGLALEMSAQTDVYTGLPCISNVGTRRWSYDVVDSEKKHTVLQQFDSEMLWEERESVQKDGSAYYVVQMKLNYKVVPEMSWLYRQEGAKIYFYDEDRQGETLMMDFGLKEGDTFLRECGSYTLEAEVVAVYDTTIIENYWDTPYTARAIKLQGKEPHTQYKDIWVEGIGSIKTGLYPTWKASSSDVYLLDFNTYGGNGAYILPLAPDVPQCIKMAKITKEHFDPDSYPKEETHYEFVNDTLRVWGIRDYYWDYDVCLIGGDNSIRFYEVEPEIQEEVYKLAKFEMKFDGFEPGEYTIYNDKGGIDTTLVCKGAEVPEVCDFEPILKDGRTWNYVIHDTYTMTDDYYSLQVGGDTIASDIPCKKILYIQGEKVQLHSLMYEKDGRVYSQTDEANGEFRSQFGEWMLLYDFNLKEGETFKWLGESYRVVETDTLNTYGHKRRRIHFCNEGWEYNKGAFTWIEGIGGKEGLEIPFMLPFSRYTFHLKSCYDGKNIIYSAEGEGIVNAYRPFVEEGKVWKLGWYRNGADPTTTEPERIEYQYLQGDTVINGQDCLSCMIREERRGGAQQTRCIGGAYEENGVVYISVKDSYYPYKDKFYPFYNFLEQAEKSFVLYDATLPNEGYVNRFIFDKIYYQDMDTYKGVCIDVSPYNQFKQDTTTWYQGVGYMGFYNLVEKTYPGHWLLMACAVDDEVLYYDASLMDWDNSAEAKKKKLDFTHVIKAQPRAPRRRAVSADQEGLSGEYSDAEVFVRLNALTGNYIATLTDASGQVVYRKTLLTDNVLALNTELTGYAPGDYVLTLENHEEVYSATLSIEPNGIGKVQEVQGLKGSKFKVQGLFDLQGRRLQKAPEKGIYIQDGQILVK